MTLWDDNTFNAAYEGQVADVESARYSISKVAEGDIRVGLLLEQGTSHNQIAPLSALPVLDDDSITATPLASAAVAAEYGFASFDGAVGSNPMGVCQRYTIELNNHADWLDSVGQVIYEEPSGAEVAEDFLIPAGGNTILTTDGIGRRFKLISIPAQGGVNGTITIGTTPTAYGLNPDFFRGVGIYDRMAMPSDTTTVTVDDESVISILPKGRIWVISETAVTAAQVALGGADAYVRMVTAGADVRGQFRSSPAANFAKLPGAKLLTVCDADGLTVLELGR